MLNILELRRSLLTPCIRCLIISIFDDRHTPVARWGEGCENGWGKNLVIIQHA